MAPRGMCFSGQMCYKVLVIEVEDAGQENNVAEREEAWIQGTTDYEVESKALQFILIPLIYHGDYYAKHLQHMSVVECVIRFWQNNLAANGILCRVVHMAVHAVVSKLSGSTKVLSNMKLGFLDEVAYGNELMGGGERNMLQLEQEGLTLMKDLMKKFLISVGLALEAFYAFAR